MADELYDQVGSIAMTSDHTVGSMQDQVDARTSFAWTRGTHANP